MIKQILHKLSIHEAKNIATRSLYIDRLQTILFVTTSRQSYPPRM